MDISTWGVRKCMGGVALSVERFPVLSPLSDKGAEGIASPDVQLFIMDEELFGPGLSKSIPCLWRMKKEIDVYTYTYKMERYVTSFSTDNF